MTPRVTDEERAKFEEWNRAAAIPATDADDCVKPMGLVNIIMRERARAWQAARAELAEVRAAAAGMAVLWTCPDCAFGFDAAHTEEPGGGYSCPACAEDRLRAELERLRPIVEAAVRAQEAWDVWDASDCAGDPKDAREWQEKHDASIRTERASRDGAGREGC